MSAISASPVTPSTQLESADLEIVCFLHSFQKALISRFAYNLLI